MLQPGAVAPLFFFETSHCSVSPWSHFSCVQILCEFVLNFHPISQFLGSSGRPETVPWSAHSLLFAQEALAVSMFHNALHSPTAKKILVNRRLEWCQLEQAKHSTAKACMLHTTCAVRERHAMCVVVMQPHVASCDVTRYLRCTVCSTVEPSWLILTGSKNSKIALRPI